jgi:hypothetical protein
MDKQTLIDQITERCWEEIQKHKDEDHALYITEDERSLNYLGEGTSIPDRTAKILIQSWVTESLNKFNQVYLYTCRDNACVAVEFLDDIIQYTEIREYCDEIIPNKFYIGYD